jgi:peptidyl-prolyl cis-trans isomerase SDCCAG10
VVLKTSKGDLDVEFWPQQAPLAVRNFVQLCMEGYYDGTEFHRVIRNFLIQGGYNPKTSNTNACVYGSGFANECHSRLTFRHRGMLACVNDGTPSSNGCEFFITLDRAEHLNKTATIFGKVVGDTIHNLSRFNEIDTDGEDRPEDAVYIEKAVVLVSPIEGIRPRKGVGEGEVVEVRVEKKRPRERNAALMSFAEEDGEEDEERDYVIVKRRSEKEKVVGDGVSRSEVAVAQLPPPSPQQQEEEEEQEANQIVEELEQKKKKQEDEALIPESLPKPSRADAKDGGSLVESMRQRYTDRRRHAQPKKMREKDTLNRIKRFASSLGSSRIAQPSTSKKGMSGGAPTKVITARLHDMLQDKE